MNVLKILSLLIFFVGITLIVIGGIYTPPSEVIDLPSGGFKGIGFKLQEGESISFEVQSLHTFTLYLMNGTEFSKLMDNGTFNGSFYTSTGKYMHVRFTAPTAGYYYVVIANFNDINAIEVDFSYNRNTNWVLFGGGTLIVIISFILLIFDWKSEKRMESLDSTCPSCNRRVSSHWNYCPYCREELGGDKK